MQPKTIAEPSNAAPPAAEPLALTVPAACHMLGVSRATIYREFSEGRLPKLRARGRTLITMADAKAWLARCAA